MRNKRKRSGVRTLLVMPSMGGVGSALFLFLAILLIALIVVLSSPFANLSPWGSGNNPNAYVSNGSLASQITHVWTGQSNQTVVAMAIYVVSGLHNGPPDNYDTWYNASQIPAAIAYWQKTCPGCGAWAQGNVQCFMLITAAYGLAGQLPDIGSMNAIDFWKSGFFANRPGWDMGSPTAIPYPGDMLVLDSGSKFQGVGHIATIVDVKQPGAAGQEGYAHFAEANGPGQIIQMPLRENASGQFSLGMWSGYSVAGYIRHTSFLTLSSLVTLL